MKGRKRIGLTVYKRSLPCRYPVLSFFEGLSKSIMAPKQLILVQRKRDVSKGQFYFLRLISYKQESCNKLK